MANLLRHLVVVALLTTSATLGAAQASGTSPNTGHTTRYWDCCKSSCAWPGKAPVSAPVASCDIHGQRLSDPNAPSGCDHGSAYMCADQSPWAVSNDLAYGFAAVNLAGNNENSWCCACYELTFTSGAVAGKKMVVQATNTGGDLGTNQFDLAMPGGGVGAFNGCSKQWGAPPSGYGAQYGGISSNTCSSLASALQPGCNFRFGWFQGAENPSVDFKQVTCPGALTAKSGCARSDDYGSQYSNSPTGTSSSPSGYGTPSPGNGTLSDSPTGTSSYTSGYGTPSPGNGTLSDSPTGTSSSTSGYRTPSPGNGTLAQRSFPRGPRGRNYV